MKHQRTYLFMTSLIVFLTALLASGCGDKQTSADRLGLSDNLVGRFTSEYCFLNKLASEGFGVDVYTKANLEFDADGTGVNEYRLYSDTNCATEITAGSNTFNFTVGPKYGNVTVIEVDQQNDPSDPTNRATYWLAAVIIDSGLLIDIDFRDGDSGPYATEPTEAELTAIMADPVAAGVLFQRQ